MATKKLFTRVCLRGDGVPIAEFMPLASMETPRLLLTEEELRADIREGDLTAAVGAVAPTQEHLALRAILGLSKRLLDRAKRERKRG